MSEKLRILNMVREGTISPEEAELLLKALETQENPTVETPVTLKDNRGRKSKKLRILVDADEKGKNKAKVNVTIPLSLLKSIGPIVKNSIPSNVKSELEDQGVNIGEILNTVEYLIENGLEEDIVNIDAGGEDGENAKVRIYVE
ncbi:MAG: hypothetical protein GX193_01690 [Clostridiales bacterium]|nr:hypothetical protein [Clostridiales bacterium]